MKQELSNSLLIAIDKMENISVCGRSNIYHMADVFQILDGMSRYVSRLPDEVEENND